MTCSLLRSTPANGAKSGLGLRLMRPLIHLFALIGISAIAVTVLPIAGWWARAYSGPLEQPRGDVLVVLSAASDDDGIISYSSYWRARYTLMAWQSGGFRQVVISGGGGPGIRDFLIAEGVPREHIIAEWQSKTTHESGIACSRILQNLPGEKVLLTSDFHMYRSLRVFRRAGLEMTPMPVPDVLKASQHWNDRIPEFETMVLETIKIVDYRVHGWI